MLCSTISWFMSNYHPKRLFTRTRHEFFLVHTKRSYRHDMSFMSCRHEMQTILKYMLNYELSSRRFILNMAPNKRQLVLFSALNAVLVSSSTLLQLLSILMMKFLQEQKRLNNLRYQAVMERNTALSRYRRARLR